MRRQLVGPSSSNYKQEDHKKSFVIDPAVAKTKVLYMQKLDEHINNNQSGKHAEKNPEKTGEKTEGKTTDKTDGKTGEKK